MFPTPCSNGSPGEIRTLSSSAVGWRPGCPALGVDSVPGLGSGAVLEDICEEISISCLLVSNTTWEGNSTRKVAPPSSLTKARMQIGSFNPEQSGDDLGNHTIKLFLLIPMGEPTRSLWKHLPLCEYVT